MTGTGVRRATRWSVFAALSMALIITPIGAQDADLNREIQQSQRRLERIREERARLQREVGDVRNRIRDAATDWANVEQRLSASRSVLAEVEFQSDATSEQVRETTRSLVRSQDRLSESEAVLSRRLRDIYKMGPLQTMQVLLGARSFTNLLNRYRYLQRIASFDHALVERIYALEAELEEQSAALRDRMALLGSLRQDRVSEVVQLRSVERERRSALEQFRSRVHSGTSVIEELDTDEARISTLVAALEERRRELEAARARTERATISPDDAGSLEWPLDGDVIYRFGRDERPNGTVLRWNGIGVSAATGTPVQAVRAGTVVLAGPFEGYGTTVILSHGTGVYTLYLYLEDLGVVEGHDVVAGQVVGTVGGADTPEGPHLEFQIRAPFEGGLPQAQDPLRWLRPRHTP